MRSDSSSFESMTPAVGRESSDSEGDPLSPALRRRSSVVHQADSAAPVEMQSLSAEASAPFDSLADRSHPDEAEDVPAQPTLSAVPVAAARAPSAGVSAFSKVGDQDLKGAGLWCRDLTYTLKGKPILKEVTFCAKPGELTAIMGPSGCGKTSLLNALLYRLRKGKVEGERRINGVVVTGSNIMAHAHYVMTHDIALSYLTVRETLMFTARLRTPQMSRAEQKDKVQEILELMELSECAETYVGGEWRKGISKGELKRLCIAAEMLGDPDIIVLDEPTSGLDSHLALELVAILKNVAHRSNKTVIATIHQPSQRAFELFDSLLLMSNGSVLFQGAASAAVSYFTSNTRVCPSHYSHPDFLLEIATDMTFAGARPDEEQVLQAVKEIDPETDSNADKTPLDKVFDSELLNKNGPTYSTPFELAELVESYPGSLEFKQVLEDIEQVTQMALPEACIQRKDRNLGWREEFSILYLRSLLNSVRNPLTTIVILMVTVVQAFILGGLFWQLQSDVVDSPVPHTPISQWPLWDNVVIEYLAVGIDKEGYDPFMDILADGVDGSGRQIAFDILVNQDVVTWLGEVLQCTREVYEDVFTDKAAKAFEYPPWYWPEGSILGEETRNGVSKLEARSLTAIPAEEMTLASMPLEQLVSIIMGFMQVFDFVATDKAVWPELGSVYNAELVGFWLPTVSSLSPFVSPLVCCASLEYMASTATNVKCTTHYPGRTFPEAPATHIGDITLATAKFANKFARGLSSFRDFLIKRKLAEANGERAPKQSAPKYPLRSQPGRSLLTASKRKLGSGLGGLASDLWALVFQNPNTPLYPMVQNIQGYMDRVSACTNSYCQFINENLEILSNEISNLATTLLTVLNFAGAVFFCIANLGFASYDVLLQFPKDRAIFNRETANGVHSTSPYFFAKILADLPFQLIPSFVWSTIYYWMTGMQADARLHFQYIGVCLMVSFCAYSFGYMTSALSPRLEVAVIVAPLLLVIMLVLAGFFLRDDSIPNWIEWAKYFSIYRYGFFATCATQFPPGETYGSLDNDMILPLLGVNEPRAWVSVLYLIALAVFYRLVAYLGLRFTNRRIGLEV